MRPLIQNTYKVEIVRPDDKRLTQFRESIYVEDLGIDKNYLHEKLSHSECQKNFSVKQHEDAYKFGALKWGNTQFDGITAAIGTNGLIHSISGFKRYGQFLRVGMHLYTLTRYRSKCRSMLWREAGFIDAALASPFGVSSKGLFVSIYPHNQALAKWANRLSKTENFAQLANEHSSIYENMAKFKAASRMIKFNGVYQYIFFRSYFSEPNFETNLLQTIEDVN